MLIIVGMKLLICAENERSMFALGVKPRTVLRLLKQCVSSNTGAHINHFSLSRFSLC